MGKVFVSETGFSVIEVVLVIVVLIAVFTGVYYVRYVHQNSAQIDANEGSFNNKIPSVCQNSSGGYTSTEAEKFIVAYQTGGTAYLNDIEETGSPYSGGYATMHCLETNNKKVTDTQFSYYDANPPGPAHTYSCKIKVISSTGAKISCGSSTLNI